MDAKQVRILVGVLILAAIVVFAAVKLLGDDDDGSDGPEVVGLSESELIDRAADLKVPAYWAGPQSGIDQYELTETQDGANVYVRYLTGGAEPGDENPDFLTVGTYLLQDAKQALERGAAGGGKVQQGDGYSFFEGAGNNVYVVFDNQPDLQVEVYSPDPGIALDLVNTGAVIPLQ